MFYLALTMGLEDDPVGGVERMVGLVEKTGRDHGVEQPLQMTIATTDGRSIWAFRYSSEGDSRSLYFSSAMHTLQELYPESEELRGFRTRAGWSSPSRSATFPVSGTRCQSRTWASSSRVTTSCGPLPRVLS